MSDDVPRVLVLLLLAFFVGLVLGLVIAGHGTQREMRRAICAADSATLANDTLCVRPDSSWRVRP